QNFLFTTGANEYAKIDDSKLHSFMDGNGNQIENNLTSHLVKNGIGDSDLVNFISGSYEDNNKMKEAVLSIDKALNDDSNVKEFYKGSSIISSCLFYKSGIASIALESYFNGPYLFSSSPSLIGDMFSSMSIDNAPLVPLSPTNISGVSYPVKVSIINNTRFYDYKNLNNFDISGLINENISAIANSIFDGSIRKITIDDIFPIKEILQKIALSNNCIYNNSINIPIAFYGGGLNLSTVDYQGLTNNDMFETTFNVNLVDNYISLKGNDGMSMMKALMVKTVLAVIGCQDFKFICASNNSELLQETYNNAPSVEMLKQNVS
ncbi:MAG: hypothetical protein MR270_06100, partial [Erysipelotrichaceae bacterium]|nr:hypothetical protein [Erysipelotrichaceae bacterium]